MTTTYDLESGPDEEGEATSLQGVVEPTLPGMPEVIIDQPSAYEDAFDRVQVALGMTEKRLVELRLARSEINDEIKLLVEEQELLERMAKIKKK